MLAIIGFILKIIGLILLAILGFILLAVLLVLFVPIRYQAEGQFDHGVKGKAVVSWLFHIISMELLYDQELDVGIRIFGFRLRKKEEKTVSAEAEHTKKPEMIPPETIPPESRTSETRTPQPEISESKEKERKTPKATKEPKQSKTLKTPKRRSFFHLNDRVAYFKERVSDLCRKLEELRDKKEAFFAFINKEANRHTFRLIKRQILRLFRHILPGKLSGTVRFGFDDPYITGQILAWISPFYGIYAKNLKLIPVFDKKIFDGDLKMKGRIRIGTVLAIGIRVLFDQNFRDLISQRKKR